MACRSQKSLTVLSENPLVPGKRICNSALICLWVIPLYTIICTSSSFTASMATAHGNVQTGKTQKREWVESVGHIRSLGLDPVPFPLHEGWGLGTRLPGTQTNVFAHALRPSQTPVCGVGASPWTDAISLQLTPTITVPSGSVQT